jgi:hypothetical protein
VLGYDSGTGEYAKLSRSNLFWQFFEFNTFTNQPEHTAPIATDKLLIHDSTAGTNKWTSLSGLVTNLPTITTNGPNDWFLVVTNGELKKISGNSVSNAIAGAIVSSVLPRKFTSGESNVVANSVINIAHGLGAVPQHVRFVLKCNTADLTYVEGDEVDIFGMVERTTGLPVWTGGANATNVFLSLSTTDIIPRRKDTGGASAGPITASRWKAKAYLTYFP